MKKYEMTMNLHVLNHLGINLYSNIPAVLSEVVANAWDADAEDVDIQIKEDKIIISDNGHGMDQDDINNKFLTVGYQKRENGESRTPLHKRRVMGRKGIGKLSLFSIADTIEIHTTKNGQKNAFHISTNELRDKIKKGDTTYWPTEIASDKIEIKKGTKIILKDLKKKTTNTAVYLKKRLARRFSVIGSEYKFDIKINEEKIGITDRAYFHKIKHLWMYRNDESEPDYSKFCNQQKLQHLDKTRETIIQSHDGNKYRIHGWIGTVSTAGDLKDENENLNKIVIMVRGKLAQEDILDDFNEGGLYSKYLIGEIHADFLDLDEEEDIATSNRQKIIEDNPRYKLLKEFIYKELKHIQNAWSKLRNEEGKKVALEIPVINDWFKELGKDHKKKAESLFGKINQLTLEDDEKRGLFKHSVLAFESFRYKENLDAFDMISAENIEEFGKIFAEFDDIEATLYHQIVSERLAVIKTLQTKVEENALEKVLQRYLYDHLWLLDPAWDRATETPQMEQNMDKEFNKVEAKLSDEEKRARYDIKYKKTSGKHVIIELKRASVKTNTLSLLNQVTKYTDALEKLLAQVGKENEPYEVVCIIGPSLTDWTTRDKIERSYAMLKAAHTRVVTYDQLIEDSQRAYQSFIDKNKQAGRVSNLLQNIDIKDTQLSN